MNKPKTLLLFSGGFDSTALLHRLLDEGHDVELVFFHYGQQGYTEECNRVTYWQQKYGLPLHFLDVSFHWSRTDMLAGGDGDGYLEMRNLVFLSHALSLAQARGMDNLAIGIISALDMPQHYADCTPEFLGDFKRMMHRATGIDLVAPYRNDPKALVAIKVKREYGDHVLREILDHTISCNYPDEHGTPCGECGECQSVEELHCYLDPLVN